MLNSRGANIAVRVVLTAVLVAFAQMQPGAVVKDTKGEFLFCCDTMYCAIALSSKLGGSEGRGFGFSYDMLNYFGDFAAADIEIVPGSCDSTYLDSLEQGRIDILVAAHPEKMIPAAVSDSFYVSRHIRNNICWVISSRDKNLLPMVNLWIDDFVGSRLYKRSVARHYRNYRRSGSGSVSPFDAIIKRNAEHTGIDWLLLASLMYQESQYYVGAEYKEAKGLMQVNDVTAARYGVSDLFSPEGNIKAGSLHLKYLMNKYAQEGLDSLNVIKFALASYNAGDGRIEQCRDHALSQGKDPNDWEQVVTTFDTNNKFIGATTTAYVKDILERWVDMRELVSEK